MVKRRKENTDNGLNVNNLTVVFMYAAAAAFYICIAHIYAIIKPELLLEAPLTGGLIVWIHLHTLGAITPFFIGIGFYNLKSRYKVQITSSQVFHQFLMLYIPLPFFLYLVFNREGSVGLMVSAFLMFSSVVYYIFTYANALRKIKKESRDVEFWIDAVSLYFLFQAVLFGFALACNLSLHFFRRDITHSIKLHSHSGIVGFWLMQYLNLIYRSLKTRIANDASGSKLKNTYLKYAVISLSLGIFLWTSVHDRFSWFFYVFYFSVGLSFVFILLFYLKIYFIHNKANHVKASNQNTSNVQMLNIHVIIFLWVAFAIASIMIFSKSEDMIYNKHLPFMYIFTIFYGVFIYIHIQFLASLIGEYLKTSINFIVKLRYAYITYISLSLLFIVSILFESVLYMRLCQTGLLLDFMFIGYTFNNEKKRLGIKASLFKNTTLSQ